MYETKNNKGKYVYLILRLQNNVIYIKAKNSIGKIDVTI